MKLDSVIVRNFRGYAEAQELVISDLTTVVGKNDAGKSTLLEALAIFFGNDIVKPDVGDVNVSSGISEFEITCTFSDLPGEVVLDTQATTTLADEFLLSDDGRLRVKKTWVCTGVKPKEEVSIECHHPSAENLTDLLTLNNAALKKRLLELIPAESAAEVNKSNNPAMRRALWESCPDLQLELREVPVTKEDSKRIWDKLAPLLPHFALFQSDRASRDSDNEVQDPMKLAIAAALAEPEVESMLASVVEAVQAKATDLATRTHQVLGELDAGLAEGLVPKFKSEPKWASLFGISLEGSDGVPINKRGSGVRRLVLVSFFRAEAQRQMEQGLGRNMIYAIEEPETSQHPRNQKILLDSLQKMANTEGCQVLLTTHSPAIAGQLPASSLRFISRSGDGAPQIASAGDETWSAIAEELGVLPDNRVRVLICVEGPTDVDALKSLSRALTVQDESVIDLSSDDRVAFVPMGGGTLQQWVAEHYLKGFDRPEFHLYDNDVEKYQTSLSEVNARGDGSIGRTTSRREIENYLHPDVVQQVFRIEIEIAHDTNVPKQISDTLRADPVLRTLNTSNVKSRIAESAFPLMTATQIKEIDPNGEVRGWLRDIEELTKR